jgi:hypothetical protein
MQAQILAVVMYVSIGVNLFAGAFISATPSDHPLPWYVLAGYAGFNALSSSLKSDGLPLPGISTVAKASAWLVAVLLVGNLMGCSTNQQADLDGFKVGLAAAETGASYYTNLPPCTTPVTAQVCSDPATVVKIRSAGASAFAAIQQAQGVVTAGGSVDEAALLAALTAFQNEVAALPKPTAGAH